MRQAWRVVAALAMLTASAAILLSALLFAHSGDVDERLCANQHSLIGMQRLFLEEHAAIREDLRGAGIPARHAHPRLLAELAVLIEAADCIPGDP